MNRLTLMSALFLTACATNTPVVIPVELTRETVVTCETGETSRALGRCTLALREGLANANSKLRAIGEIVSQ